MVSASYVALIGSIIAGVIGLLILWRQCFESHRNLDSAELNEPLIRNGQKRPEEAKSIADRGSVKCDKCAFDNFSHAILCAVCGAALGDASTKTKTTKRMVKQKMPIDATSRGERGVRRGEWTRKSDVEGKFFWFRTAPAGLEGKLQPGFVVRLNGSDAVWVDASTANSLDFPTGTGVVSGVATSAVNVVSKKPFPSKYVDFVERANELAPADYRVRIKFTQSTAEDVYHVTMLQLAALKADDVRAKFVISYVGPDDSVMSSASSVNWQQDWFASICQHLVDEQVGLFTCVNQTDRTYFINPLSDPSSSYLAAGRFIGRALLHGDLMSFHLATPLLKILLGQPLSFHDLEHFDAVTYKSLSTLLSASTDVSSLSLDFSVQEKQLDGSVLVVDLVPNGRNIAVTNDNKLEYLTRVTQRVLVERVSVQLHDLCVGFYEVVPQDLLLLFDAGELDYLLCGSDEIDIDDWKKHTKYDASLMLHCAMDYLWEFLREMPEDYKRRLLHFSTGSTRVPVGGFAALKAWDGRVAPFTLEGIATVDSKYFMSVPCVNRLIIPRYDIEKESMKNALYNMLEPTAYAAILPPGYDTSI